MEITQSMTWWHHTLDLLITHHTIGTTTHTTHNGVKKSITLLHWNQQTGTLVCLIDAVPYRWQLLCPLKCQCWRWYSFTHDTIVTLHSRRPAQKKTVFHKTASFTPHLKSPLGGRILKTLIVPGTFVTKDTPLIIIESMKMENEIRAPHDAFIKTVSIQSNDVVEADQLLIVFAKKGPHNGIKSPTDE